MVVSLSIACVLVSVLAGISADSHWWATGKPFQRTTPQTPTKATTLKWFISPDGPPRSCQCSKPHHCRDLITLKTPERPIPTCPTGQVCCQSLKQAPAFDEDDANGVIPSKVNEDEDIGGEEDPDEIELSEEDPDEPYEDIGEESEEVIPPPVIKKTKDKGDTATGDVIDLDDIVGTGDDKPEEFNCGIETPYLVIDDKAAPGDKKKTRFGQYPWNLIILYSESGTVIASCGATLIEPTFAITAAHCVQGKTASQMTVRAGDWDLNEEDEPFPHVDMGVKSIIIHPRYQKYGLHNDIAFIVLSSAFELSPNIGKLCIPKEKETIRNPCIATGWGMSGDIVSPSAQSIMKAVEVKIESPRVCQEKLQQTDLGKNYQLSKTAFCAIPVEKGQDTSIGDGGGPLFCKSTTSPSHYVFVGITSGGKLQYADAPGIYTSVKIYHPWIVEQMMKVLNMF